MNDPTGLVAALSVLPGAAKFLAYLPLLIVLCKVVIVVWSPPPAAGSKLVGLYNLINKVALNFGGATNAVMAGMPAPVQAAAAEAAKLAAAAPEQTVVAGTTPVQAPVIAVKEDKA